MQKIGKFIFQICVIIMLAIVVLYTSIESITYSDKFYKTQYDKNNTVLFTEIDMKDLMEITDQIQDFLKVKREDFNIYSKVNNVYGPIFDDQEQIHMKDVQVIFIRFKKIRNLFVIVLLMLFIYYSFKDKKFMLKTLKQTSFVTIIAFIVLGIGISMSFDKLFTVFHKLLFTNDLWLFPPDSLLINILPENFFIACGINIVIYCLTFYIFMFLITSNSLKKFKGES